MHHTHKTILTLAGTVLLFTAAQTHALTQYSDRSTWQTAAGGGSGDLFDNFNDVVNDITGLSPALDRGPYSIDDTSPNAQSYLDGIGDDGGTPAFPNVNGTSYLFVWTSTEFETGPIYNDVLELTFDQAVTAVGFDHKPWGGDSSNTVNFYSNTADDGSFVLAPDQQPTFVGMVFDAPITSLLFRFEGNDSGRFGLDDLEAYSVPEPSSLALLGLGGLIACCRRQSM